MNVTIDAKYSYIIFTMSKVKESLVYVFAASAMAVVGAVTR